MARSDSLTTRLIRSGFEDTDRARRFLLELAGYPVFAGRDVEGADFLGALGRVASPDEALLGLLRCVEALDAAGSTTEFGAAWDADERFRTRLLSVLGASTALTDHLVRHPEAWRELTVTGEVGTAFLNTPASAPGELRAELLRAVGADPGATVPVAADGGEPTVRAMRARYRDLLLALAADDLTAAAPEEIVPDVARVLADLAAAALEAALAIARAAVGEDAAGVRMAIIGMGKCGGRELNYVSDVDVIYVVEGGPPNPDAAELDVVELGAVEVARIGTQLATALASACAAPGAEPALWEVDAALRPEGKRGPLVRTLDEHSNYYASRADNWEFQALLKARPVAGDVELGRMYFEAMNPLVWHASEREGFVESVQKMRLRVTDHIPEHEVPQQLKLGPGGLRDVEFSAQLLQMVHGRADEALRVANTWEALDRLSAGGYVGREDAAALSGAYRFLRVVEHRLQLVRLQRTHLVPTQPAALRHLARMVYPPAASAANIRTAEHLEKTRKSLGRDVRDRHQRIFYRPVLATAAQLPGDQVLLSEENAKARLAAVGYRDPMGAMKHLAALTKGVSRRAAIQRQLLPVLLEWLSAGVDPDAGLLAFRRLSDGLGTSHWYLRMLRDSGVAAQRMTRLLSVSTFVSDLLEVRPSCAAWLDDPAQLQARSRGAIAAEMAQAVQRHEPGHDAVQAVRGIFSREVLRTGMRDVLGLAAPRDVPAELSSAMEAAIQGALDAVSSATIRRPSGRAGERPEQNSSGLPAGGLRFAVIAMGRLGGAEVGYASDADLLFVYDSPATGAEADDARKVAAQIATALTAELKQIGEELAITLDPALRPEGKKGALVRSLDSYAAYYAQWSEPWEAQALLRARPIAGDESLGAEYLRLVDPLRYPETMPEAAVRQVRRLKARMESERLPRGADPNRHLKLGRGGLSDVEWVVQLLQLRHAGAIPTLRTTSTLGALEAAAAAGLIDPGDAQQLAETWLFVGRVRDAMVLWRGRAAASLPTDRLDLEAVARLLGYPQGGAAEVEDDYLRSTRRARRIVERVFYD